MRRYFMLTDSMKGRSARIALRHALAPLPGRRVRMGSLRRMRPFSDSYGFERGLPIDRYYIEDFLTRIGEQQGYSGGVLQGRVLEIGGREYVDRFGRADQVDVLHENAANPAATIVGDLTVESTLPAGVFDCILCTQTLHVIYDFRAALQSLHRGLKPGGTLLATIPGITPGCRPDRDLWGDWWRFTSSSARRVFEETFPAEEIHVEAYGNLLSATAFLYGLAAHELKPEELRLRDPDFEVTIAIRARRPPSARFGE